MVMLIPWRMDWKKQKGRLTDFFSQSILSEDLLHYIHKNSQVQISSLWLQTEIVKTKKSKSISPVFLSSHLLWLTMCIAVSNCKSCLLLALTWKLNFLKKKKKTWDIIDVQDYISFRCTTQGFNICIYCETITDYKSS